MTVLWKLLVGYLFYDQSKVQVNGKTTAMICGSLLPEICIATVKAANE
jgi:hypothetical protein